MAEVKIIAERCKSYVVPVNMEACVACCQCAYICPDGAIEIYK